MHDWTKEAVERQNRERAKERKTKEILEYFISQHNKSGLKYAVWNDDFTEGTLEGETHFYLRREGFKWVGESGCFVGVTDRIYQDAKEVVDCALRKYHDIVKQVGTVGNVSLIDYGRSVSYQGKLIRLDS